MLVTPFLSCKYLLCQCTQFFRCFSGHVAISDDNAMLARMLLHSRSHSLCR